MATTDGAVAAVGPQLLLIDPVSVAGVSSGPPLFDLVKYVSYATGELAGLALRLGGRRRVRRRERLRVRCPLAERGAGRLPRPRLAHALSARVRARYGPVDGRAYRLIDGYFSVAMAVNTGGTQRRARLLKATQDFNAAANPGVVP